MGVAQHDIAMRFCDKFSEILTTSLVHHLTISSHNFKINNFTINIVMT